MGLGFTLDDAITIPLKRHHHKLLIRSPHRPTTSRSPSVSFSLSPKNKAKPHVRELRLIFATPAPLEGKNTVSHSLKPETFFKSRHTSYRYWRLCKNTPRRGNYNPLWFVRPAGEERHPAERRGSSVRGKVSQPGCRYKVRRKRSKWLRGGVRGYLSFTQNMFSSFFLVFRGAGSSGRLMETMLRRATG